MSGTGAASRAAAARLVAEVIGAGRTLDAALAAADLQDLSAPDQALARSLAYGALRWHHRHRALLGQLLHRPLPARETLLEALLSVGMFQLLDADYADHAAIAATVEACRLLRREPMTGLVNATLRRLQRERAALLDAARTDDVRAHSHPDWLVAALRADWPDEVESVLRANQQRPPLWLRVNALRSSTDDYLARLVAAGMTATTSAGLPHAVRLAEPVAVSALPGFDAGLLSVQDAASQFAAPLLDAAPGMRVLDACAAPGGKTTHLLERAGGDLDLLALDVDAQRLERLQQNLTRLGLRARLTAADARAPDSWWDGRPFDRILIDAPCTGTGVIRRHPDIKWLRRAADVPGFAERQHALLAALWPLLAPAGRLLYATCSVLRAENDAVVRRFLDGPAAAGAAACDVFVPQGRRPPDAQGVQLLPGAGATDGLYYALMAAVPAAQATRTQA
jgi:16S rRNA (cytosine967-C5)-methyltransferase